MSIQLSYLSAIFLLVYFGIGIYIFYFFRKRFHGRFEGQGYKFPAIIYFISVPLIIAIGTNFFNDYNPSQVLTFEIDVMFKIAFLYAILPTIVYISIGLYILSLEYKKGPGYKLPALIYFISVPSLVVIGITMIFGLNYISGRYEQPNKPAGYELYKFLVLKDIIPRSGQSIEDKEEIKVADENENTNKSQKITKSDNKTNIEKQTLKTSIKKFETYENFVQNLSIGDEFETILKKKNEEKNEVKVKILRELNKNQTNANNEKIEVPVRRIIFTTTDNSFIYKYSKEYFEYPGSEDYQVYRYSYGTNDRAYFKNLPINSSIYKKFNSKHVFMRLGDISDQSIIIIGLNMSIEDISNLPEIEDLRNKVDEKKIEKKAALKIAMDIIFKKINYFLLSDNRLESHFSEKDKKENNGYPGRVIVNYKSGNISGLCKNPEKYQVFMNNHYKNKDCKEILFDSLNRLNDEFIEKINNYEKRFISQLNNLKFDKLKTDEKYYALVIGNNNYQYLEKLDAAENDAKVIADILENKYGFEVELLLNGDYSTTVNSIFNMTKKLKENDNLLIYYAGHGELDKSENRGYWLPVNASTKSRAEWISNQRIVDRVKATKAKHVLLMVDSCFSGSLMRGGELFEENETIDKKYIERLKKKKTRLVITSGGNEPVVDSDGGNHSLFALKLIDTLKNNDNVINSQILFENIRRYVVANADQTPERAMVHKTGHDGGDFLFFPVN